MSRSTFILVCYLFGDDPWNSAPAAYLGPYTKAEAEAVKAKLSCRADLRKAHTEPSEWMLIDNEGDGQ